MGATGVSGMISNPMSMAASKPVRIAVMEGDGIGPEITAATMHVLAVADGVLGLGLSFIPVSIGLAALRSEGTTLPDRAVAAAREADGPDPRASVA